MAGRKRAGVRRRHERPRLGVHERRPQPADPLPQREREPIGGEVGGDEQRQEPGPPPEHGEHDADEHEHEPLGRDAGQVDDERVQPADAVVDDPAF